jgi:hypothetical protein
MNSDLGSPIRGRWLIPRAVAPEIGCRGTGYGRALWPCHDPRAILATMTSKRDRSATRNQLARWDNEGGAPLSDQDAAEETQAALAEDEENILRCLGAAVIMQWSDLPTHIQRRLFANAASMGEPRHLSQLREQIARFLHGHKDDEH